MTDSLVHQIQNDVGTRPSRRVAAHLQGAAGRLRAHWQRRLTRNILEGLDDATLQDLGIDRSEITSLIYDTSGDRIRRYEGP
jgi:uncharacterized protein YjiS (DUF1127 family)